MKKRRRKIVDQKNLKKTKEQIIRSNEINSILKQAYQTDKFSDEHKFYENDKYISMMNLLINLILVHKKMSDGQYKSETDILYKLIQTLTNKFLELKEDVNIDAYEIINEKLKDYGDVVVDRKIKTILGGKYTIYTRLAMLNLYGGTFLKRILKIPLSKVWINLIAIENNTYGILDKLEKTDENVGRLYENIIIKSYLPKTYKSIILGSINTTNNDFLIGKYQDSVTPNDLLFQLIFLDDDIKMIDRNSKKYTRVMKTQLYKKMNMFLYQFSNTIQNYNPMYASKIRNIVIPINNKATYSNIEYMYPITTFERFSGVLNKIKNDNDMFQKIMQNNKWYGMSPVRLLILAYSQKNTNIDMINKLKLWFSKYANIGIGSDYLPRHVVLNDALKYINSGNNEGYLKSFLNEKLKLGDQSYKSRVMSNMCPGVLYEKFRLSLSDVDIEKNIYPMISACDIYKQSLSWIKTIILIQFLIDKNSTTTTTTTTNITKNKNIFTGGPYNNTNTSSNIYIEKPNNNNSNNNDDEFMSLDDDDDDSDEYMIDDNDIETNNNSSTSEINSKSVDLNKLKIILNQLRDIVVTLLLNNKVNMIPENTISEKNESQIKREILMFGKFYNTNKDKDYQQKKTFDNVANFLYTSGIMMLNTNVEIPDGLSLYRNYFPFSSLSSILMRAEQIILRLPKWCQYFHKILCESYDNDNKTVTTKIIDAFYLLYKTYSTEWVHSEIYMSDYVVNAKDFKMNNSGKKITIKWPFTIENDNLKPFGIDPNRKYYYEIIDHLAYNLFDVNSKDLKPIAEFCSKFVSEYTKSKDFINTSKLIDLCDEYTIKVSNSSNSIYIKQYMNLLFEYLKILMTKYQVKKMKINNNNNNTRVTVIKSKKEDFKSIAIEEIKSCYIFNIKNRMEYDSNSIRDILKGDYSRLEYKILINNYITLSNRYFNDGFKHLFDMVANELESLMKKIMGNPDKYSALFDHINKNLSNKEIIIEESLKASILYFSNGNVATQLGMTDKEREMGINEIKKKIAKKKKKKPDRALKKIKKKIDLLDKSIKNFYNEDDPIILTKKTLNDLVDEKIMKENEKFLSQMESQQKKLDEFQGKWSSNLENMKGLINKENKSKFLDKFNEAISKHKEMIVNIEKTIRNQNDVLKNSLDKNSRYNLEINNKENEIQKLKTEKSNIFNEIETSRAELSKMRDELSKLSRKNALNYVDFEDFEKRLGEITGELGNNLSMDTLNERIDDFIKRYSRNSDNKNDIMLKKYHNSNISSSTYIQPFLEKIKTINANYLEQKKITEDLSYKNEEMSLLNKKIEKKNGEIKKSYDIIQKTNQIKEEENNDMKRKLAMVEKINKIAINDNQDYSPDRVANVLKEINNEIKNLKSKNTPSRELTVNFYNNEKSKILQKIRDSKNLINDKINIIESDIKKIDKFKIDISHLILESQTSKYLTVNINQAIQKKISNTNPTKHVTSNNKTKKRKRDSSSSNNTLSKDEISEINNLLTHKLFETTDRVNNEKDNIWKNISLLEIISKLIRAYNKFYINSTINTIEKQKVTALLDENSMLPHERSRIIGLEIDTELKGHDTSFLVGVFSDDFLKNYKLIMDASNHLTRLKDHYQSILKLIKNNDNIGSDIKKFISTSVLISSNNQNDIDNSESSDESEDMVDGNESEDTVDGNESEDTVDGNESDKSDTNDDESNNNNINDDGDDGNESDYDSDYEIDEPENNDSQKDKILSENKTIPEKHNRENSMKSLTIDVKEIERYETILVYKQNRKIINTLNKRIQNSINNIGNGEMLATETSLLEIFLSYNLYNQDNQFNKNNIKLLIDLVQKSKIMMRYPNNKFADKIAAHKKFDDEEIKYIERIRKDTNISIGETIQLSHQNHNNLISCVENFIKLLPLKELLSKDSIKLFEKSISIFTSNIMIRTNNDNDDDDDDDDINNTYVGDLLLIVVYFIPISLANKICNKCRDNEYFPDTNLYSVLKTNYLDSLYNTNSALYYSLNVLFKFIAVKKNIQTHWNYIVNYFNSYDFESHNFLYDSTDRVPARWSKILGNDIYGPLCKIQQNKLFSGKVNDSMIIGLFCDELLISMQNISNAAYELSIIFNGKYTLMDDIISSVSIDKDCGVPFENSSSSYDSSTEYHPDMKRHKNNPDGKLYRFFWTSLSGGWFSSSFDSVIPNIFNAESNKKFITKIINSILQKDVDSSITDTLKKSIESIIKICFILSEIKAGKTKKYVTFLNEVSTIHNLNYHLEIHYLSMIYAIYSDMKKEKCSINSDVNLFLDLILMSFESCSYGYQINSDSKVNDSWKYQYNYDLNRRNLSLENVLKTYKEGSKWHVPLQICEIKKSVEHKKFIIKKIFNLKSNQFKCMIYDLSSLYVINNIMWSFKFKI